MTGDFTNSTQTEALESGFALLMLPKLLGDLKIEISKLWGELRLLRENSVRRPSEEDTKDGYLTPENARKYLDMSKGTFDKYRYSTKIKIKGYKLDGANWYKKSDLDRFMLTYEGKSALAAAV